MFKNLFKKDNSVELALTKIIEQQQEFISKNINERVVYTRDKEYDNIEVPDESPDHEDEEFVEELTSDHIGETLINGRENNNEE